MISNDDVGAKPIDAIREVGSGAPARSNSGIPTYATNAELAPARGREAPPLHPQALEVTLDRIGASLAELHVVLLLAARIGATDELHAPPLERPLGEALGDLREEIALARRQVGRVVVEFRG